jgi:patatin-like phospholipase/acyl hydrolase
MAKLQDELELEEKPRPADYFDLIGGTSTGGYVSHCAGPNVIYD